MAIVVESYSADYASVNGDTELSISVPSGTQDGDLLLALGLKVGSNDVTPPGGWTEIYYGTATHCCAWYKVASSESGSYVWTMDGTADGHVCIFRLSGADSTTIDVAAAEEETGSSAIIGCPDITITTDGSMAFRWGGKAVQAVAYTYSSTEGVEEYEAVGLTQSCPLGVYSHASQSSGSYTAADLVLSGSVNPKYGMTIAIAPSGSPPSPYTTYFYQQQTAVCS